MGHKKRTSIPRYKHPPTGDEEAEHSRSPKTEGATVVLNGAQVMDAELDGHGYATVKQECERALTSLRRGSHTKALRLLKDAFGRYGCDKKFSPQSAALIQRVQATVCVKLAGVIDDHASKQRHFKMAIESARRAVELSPNSVEFAHFYANLLYEMANEGKEYEEVMRECDKALEIKCPVDPGKESLQDDQIGNPEARIEHVQNELRSLKQKASISSISTWMKTLGSGEEIRLIPIRRTAEDPMELRLVQTTKRPNEIKKAAKTPEERRKEIEVRVAAARLMQQQQQQKVESENKNDKGGGDGVLVERRVPGVERRKYNRRNASKMERKNKVRAFWESLSDDTKKDLMKIKISDLRCYVQSLKDGITTADVIDEALRFSEENKSWKFWTCCRCSSKFLDHECHIQHVVHEHMGNLLPKMQTVIPQAPENDWIEMILNYSWKPLDASSAVTMFEGRSDKPQTADLVNDLHSGEHISECEDCPKDVWESVPEKDDMKKDNQYNTDVSADTDKISSRREFTDWKQSLDSAYHSVDSWPVCDDPERAKLLEKIHCLFETLIKYKCLAATHLTKVMQFTIDELQGLSSGSYLLNRGVDQTPLCICFLGPTQLRKIVKFLQELTNSGGLNRCNEKDDGHEESSVGPHYDDVKEDIVLNPDASWIYLDERLLGLDGGSCTTREETGMTKNSDAFLSWVFDGPSAGDPLQYWIRNREEKMREGLEIIQILEKEFYNLQGLCERKCENLNYEEALQAVEDMCLEEARQADSVSQPCQGVLDSVLKKRKRELEDDVEISGKKIELEVISNIMKDAVFIKSNQYGYEEHSGAVASQLCDLESGDDNSWRSKDYYHQVDTCIEVAIQRQKEHLCVELSKVDCRMMRVVTGMQQLELKLDPVSANDYRLILLPLVKLYLMTRLEELAEKDATEKSDAAREAFLAELARDSNKGVRGGSDIARSSQEKTKDKKKTKDNKRPNVSKIFAANGYQLLDDENEENISSHAMSEDEFHSVDEDVLKQQEDEFRRKVELEAEERMLEETLEYQRQIENEAKRKHLAEQNQRISDSFVSCSDLRVINGNMNSKKALEASGGVLNNGDLIYQNAMPETRFGTEITSDVSQNYKIRGFDDEDQSQGGSFEDGCHRRENQDVEENGTRACSSEFNTEDDEQKFQADLKMAVRESLDTFQAHWKVPCSPSSPLIEKTAGELSEVSNLINETPPRVMEENGVFGAGLRNDVGEYNCFLNVIIQSLWHIRQFRDQFLAISVSAHSHIGEPCVVCALYDIFTALSIASNKMQTEAVAPTSLRVALSNLYPDSKFFQEAQMNDASEVLVVIFECLHKAFTCGSSSESESIESNSIGSWDCKNEACIVHSLFGMDIFEQMNCPSCGLESRHMKYTSFFHNINASALRTMKVMCPDSAFDELLNLVEMNDQLACDVESSGCGKPNYIHHILATPPHVFTTVLGWQKTCESADDIAGTLSSLNTEIDMSVLYRGLDPQTKHSLVSVVCYYGQHYHCFAYNHDRERWFMYDDKNVKVIGNWEEVVDMCEKGRLQPQVLFFEEAK